MRKFKEFLKVNEAGISPTLSPNSLQLPNSQSVKFPTSFSGWHDKKQNMDNPELATLRRIGELMQTIISDSQDPNIKYDGPMSKLGISKRDIVGNVQSGYIQNINKNAMMSSSLIGSQGGITSSEFNYATRPEVKIFIDNGRGKVTLDMSRLYKVMEDVLKKGNITGAIAGKADNALNSLTKGLTTPANGAMQLQRKTYSV